MKSLALPFLLLTRRLTYRPTTIGDGRRFAVAFSTLDIAVAFMRATGESNWEFSLVIRTGIEDVAANLQTAELMGVCLDPLPDETGGTAFSIAEIRSVVDS
jgi:hypothetical protein